MGMKLFSKLGSFLRIFTRILKRLFAVRTVNGATHSQKDSVEANVDDSLAEMVTERTVMLLGGLELAAQHSSGHSSRRRGTCTGKSTVHPRGSNLTGCSQVAKLPLSSGCSLESLTFTLVASSSLLGLVSLQYSTSM